MEALSPASSNHRFSLQHHTLLATGVTHRDLKPENILLKSREDDTSIKLADLGFAKLITSKEMLMTTPCG